LKIDNYEFDRGEALLDLLGRELLVLSREAGGDQDVSLLVEKGVLILASLE
jgi:hypothetical protein